MSESQTFHEHIAELRRRLLWVFLAIGVSATIGYNLRIPIIKLLQQPLGKPLFYSSPAGSFNFVMQVAAVVGIFVALPVMVYQLLRFIEPALPKRIQTKSMMSVISVSFMLALSGAAFAFLYIVPTSLKFFGGYSNEQIQPLISANEYLRFVINSLVTFAVIFQIPLVFYFIDRIKPIPPSKLLRYQRHTIVAAFLIAVLLPFTYDPITQFIIAIPIVLLFYLSVCILWLTNHRRAIKTTKLNKAPFILTEQKTPLTRPMNLQEAQTNVEQPKLRPSLSLDGFVSAPQRSLGPRQFARSSISSTTNATRPVILHHEAQIRRQKLSIDGISPLLGTS